MFILLIIRFGLLATVAALTIHFILLRAPLTTEFDSWRGPLGLWYLGVVAVLGLGAIYIARTGARTQLARIGAGTGSNAAASA